MSVALVDNDVLYKTTLYGLAVSLLNERPYGATQFHALGAAKFIIAKKISKRPPTKGVKPALEELEELQGLIKTLEPTADEIALAAEIEYLASKSRLELDAGESQLCSVLLAREWPLIFTGDKRAITAISGIMSQGRFNFLAGRVVCLEQLFQLLLSRVDPTLVRAAVCTEPQVDRALTNCFACQSQEPRVDSFHEGLRSYVNHLNTSAPGVLQEPHSIRYGQVRSVHPRS